MQQLAIVPAAHATWTLGCHTAETTAALRKMQSLDALSPEEPLDLVNFDEWIFRMEKRLRKLHLWDFVEMGANLIKANRKLTRLHEFRVAYMDQCAGKFLFKYIAPEVFGPYNITLPMMGSDLLRVLKQPPKPFRLMELPRELRIEIYKYVVVRMSRNSRQKGEDDTKHRVTIFTETNFHSNRLSQPALLHVSQQVRSEASEVYYQNNHFQGQVIRLSYVPQDFMEIRLWAELLAKEDKKNLREFTVQETTFPDEESRLAPQDHIHVRFTPNAGLTATVNVDCEDEDGACTQMAWQELVAGYSESDGDHLGQYCANADLYCAMIDQRRVSEGWNSSGIIEYFLAEPQRLLRIIESEPFRFDADGTEVECEETNPDVRWRRPLYDITREG